MAEEAPGVAAWAGEREAAVHLQQNKTVGVWLLPGLLPVVDADRLLRFARAASYKRDPDTVDQQPSFEVYIMEGAAWSPAAAELGLQDWADARLLAYVRQRFACSECVLCESLIRRYLPGERRRHPIHFDFHAYATVVVGLNPEDFTGGLYVQTNDSDASREYIDLGRGDAVFHQFGLRHGVHVEEGVRYSLIFWVKDSLQSCLDKSTPWYFGLAEAGDADAQWQSGKVLAQGQPGIAKDLAKAAAWYAAAARQGHLQAMESLAGMYRRGEGVKQDPALAAKWLQKAARAGHASAQFNLGYLFLKGQGVARNATKSLKLFRAAARAGHVMAMVNLGWLYEGGAGLPAEAAEAEAWYQRAAESGSDAAAGRLAKLLRAAGRAAEAEAWGTRAAGPRAEL